MSEENSVPQFPSEQDLTRFFGVEPERGPSSVTYSGIGIRDDIDCGSCGFSLDYSSGLCSISHSDACSYMPDGETQIASRIWIDWDAKVLYIEWAKREPGSAPAAIMLATFPQIRCGSPLRTPEPHRAESVELLCPGIRPVLSVATLIVLVIGAALVGFLIAFVVLAAIQGCSMLFSNR
jgi:hypothetical protein